MTQGDFNIPMCPLMVSQQGHEQQTAMATDNLRKNRANCAWLLGETRRGEFGNVQIAKQISTPRAI
jgi:hypothetical protein